MKIFIDTAPFIYLIENHPIFASKVKALITVITGATPKAKLFKNQFHWQDKAPFKAPFIVPSSQEGIRGELKLGRHAKLFSEARMGIKKGSRNGATVATIRNVRCTTQAT